MGDSSISVGRVLTTLAVLLWITTGCGSHSDDELWERTTWPGKPNLPAQAVRGQPVLYVKFNLPRLRAADTKRIEFPLVHCQNPGTLHLTGERIAEILGEEDAAPRH